MVQKSDRTTEFVPVSLKVIGKRAQKSFGGTWVASQNYLLDADYAATEGKLAAIGRKGQSYSFTTGNKQAACSPSTILLFKLHCGKNSGTASS